MLAFVACAWVRLGSDYIGYIGCLHRGLSQYRQLASITVHFARGFYEAATACSNRGHVYEDLCVASGLETRLDALIETDNALAACLDEQPRRLGFHA